MKIETPKWIELVSGNRAKIDLRMPVEKVQHQIKKGNLQVNPQTVDDVIPKPEDFLMAKFRSISAAYLGESGYYLDFTKPGMLRASIPLMLPREKSGTRRRYLKFHRNHRDAVENIIGRIDDATWGEASGDQTYPGINIDVMIDWKLAPNEARQIMADPPLVDSCSISFYFDWEKSHPDLEDWKFWMLLGQEVEGQIVRIVVTEIVEYRHIALVHEGADEEADKLEVSKQQKEKSKQQEIGGDPTMKFNLSDEQVAALAKLLGVSVLATPEELIDRTSGMVAAHENLRDEHKALSGRAGSFDKLLLEKRAGVKALVIKVDGEQSKGTQAVIDKLEWESLGDLEKEYQAKLEAKFPIKCMTCGGTNCERRSSIEEPPVQGANGKGQNGERVRESNFRVK